MNYTELYNLVESLAYTEKGIDGYPMTVNEERLRNIKPFCRALADFAEDVGSEDMEIKINPNTLNLEFSILGCIDVYIEGFESMSVGIFDEASKCKIVTGEDDTLTVIFEYPSVWE